MISVYHKLDDEAVLGKYDPKGVFASLGKIPDQIEQAWNECADIPLRRFKPAVVVISGMGGSGLGPHLLQTSFGSRVRIPIIISTGYTLPGYVGKNTLVVSVSYSGNTEETITAYKEAGMRGAERLVITTGGTLARLAGHDKVPVYKFKPLHNPCGQPRMGVGYPIGAIARLIERYGLANGVAGEMASATTHARGVWKTVNFEQPYKDNRAKQLAVKFEKTIPLFVGTRFLGGALHTVANQMQENAKHLAIFYPLPELNHHLLEALSHPRDISRTLYTLFFDTKLANPMVRERMAVTRAVFQKQGIKSEIFELSGEDSLSVSLELVMIGGAIGVYLALLHKLDPSKIPWVDYFKQHMG